MTTTEKRVRDLFAFSNGKTILLNGWEINDDEQGGQPNGSGHLEPSDYRDWFTAERETHHRSVITLYGPWEDGATKAALAEQQAIQRNRENDLRQYEDNILRKAHQISVRRNAAIFDNPRTDRIIA